MALKRRSGVEVWRNESLKLRSLSAPAVVGDYVVVADLDGYVHWFDRATGTLAGRAKAGGDRVTNAPLAVDGTLYLINDEGDIVGAARPSPRAATQAPPPAKRRAEPAPAATPVRRRAAERRARQSAKLSILMLPVIAIVGRPNVGKSTLFNTLTKTRDAIVADVPGVTRDRQYGYGRLGPVQYVCIDTGGLVENPSGMDALMRIQTEHAIKEADRLIFVADARAGLTTAGSVLRAANCAARASRCSSRSTRPKV